MSNKFAYGFRPRLTVSAIVLAVFAACGGGGGDGGAPAGTIDLSVANRDTVAHAVAAGAIGLGGADRVVSSAAVPVALRRATLSRAATIERPLAVIGPIDEPCTVSGLSRTTLDDRDNNGLPSVGDVLTIEFLQCKDVVDETVNGTLALTFTELSASGFGGMLSLTSYSTVEQSGSLQHAFTMNGNAQLAYSEPSLSMATLRLTTDGPVTAVVSTPVFSDTVTLHSGFVQQSVIDMSVQPPAGGTTPGSATTTASGRLTSQAAGGEVTVATTSSMVQYADDSFPRSGAVHITGRTGSLQITALSAEQVQLDLDANGDGTYEDSTTQRWDWLI
jgi:hypothetical protein